MTETLRRKYVNSSLTNKTCSKCGKTYPRTGEFFYKRKHETINGSFEYSAQCIACENKRGAEWKKRNRLKMIESRKKYLNTERGYFLELFASVKKSKHGNEFKNFDEFFNCWVEQQKIYGIKCPYTGIEMTRIKGINENGVRRKAIKTNISKDRILSFKPYSKENIKFICFYVNSMKGGITPKMAKQYLQFVKERFGTDEIE